jgi:hypothetical protein
MDMDEPEKPDLSPWTPKRLMGRERLKRNGTNLPVTVLDFWRWSVSDLLSNLTRGRLAEFIVAHALRIDVWKGVRREWDRFDLLTPNGAKVEVKASGYLQSWHQANVSKIGWRLGPTRAWDDATNVFAPNAEWQADVYVLAFLADKNKKKVDPLDVARWCFYVVPVRKLRDRPDARFVTPSMVETFGVKKVGSDGLEAAVETASHER